MDEKFSSGLLSKYAREHGGISVGRNGGIRDGADGFYGGSSIDLSMVTDDMLLGEPFEFDWRTCDISRKNNRIDFNDGFSVALKPYNLMNKDNINVPGKKAKPSRYWTGIGDTGDHDKSRGGWVGNGKDDIGPEYNGFSVSTRAGESQNYRNALKNNYDDIKYFDEHPERADSKTGKERARRNIDQIHKWGKELLKNNKNMRLSEQQLKALIYESVKRVINEIGYHEKQDRQKSEDEHEAWLQKKGEAKKKYFANQKKDDDNGGAIDHYDYKHGKGNFPVMAKESRVRMSAKDFQAFITESVKSVIKEMNGFPRSYDSWRTREPEYFSKPDMISKDDFMDAFYSQDKNELLEWVKDYAPEVYEEAVAAERYGRENAFNVVYERLGWKDIASEFLDMKPVNNYPGDNDPDPRDYRGVDECGGVNETTLDYDMDNFSGRWGRGPRYDILVDGEVYYSDVPDESVDRLCADLERQGYENIQVQEL